ncbi:hypothetical protein DPMN_127996 [Dreissena polymorpha]|uniref:Uncharacterized protein n=1 Tax=Dreissena polymorpha TaxID=45954 RepID=A0A9D4H007_DREPO|nr:hypothetical protein DPMN_127996 [Dreissena polymorpha]
MTGNGTSIDGGRTTLGNALSLTCSATENVRFVSWRKTANTPGSPELKLLASGVLSNATCGFDPPPPSGLICICVSAREYTCTIQALTVADNGDRWRCDAAIDGQFKFSNYVFITVNGMSK